MIKLQRYDQQIRKPTPNTGTKTTASKQRAKQQILKWNLHYSDPVDCYPIWQHAYMHIPSQKAKFIRIQRASGNFAANAQSRCGGGWRRYLRYTEICIGFPSGGALAIGHRVLGGLDPDRPRSRRFSDVGRLNSGRIKRASARRDFRRIPSKCRAAPNICAARIRGRARAPAKSPALRRIQLNSAFLQRKWVVSPVA